MRLYSVTLKNYIGIYNGLGLDSITIDFYKCINPVTIIKGDNGSGKSTLFNALTPFSDPSCSFIPNTVGSKEISYVMDSGDIIYIKYICDKKSTKCSIIKKDTFGNKVDLNPNMNITEGKEMIKSLFDFDPQYVTLSQLSSDNRGLADKKPAERKRLISSMMDNISSYNEIYKKLSKKSSYLKSMISSINSKISSIGDISQIQSNIKQLDEEIGNLEDRKNQLLFESGSYKSKLEDIDTDTINGRIKELSNKIEELDSLIVPNDNMDSFGPYGVIPDINVLEEYLPPIIKNIEDITAKINDCNTEISINSKMMNELSDTMNSIDAKLESYSGVGSPEEIKTSIEKIENELKSLLEEKENIGLSFDTTDIFTGENIDCIIELGKKINICIDSANIIISDIDNPTYSSMAINRVLYGVVYQSMRTDLSSICDNLSNIEKAIDEQSRRREESDGYDLIPASCSKENRSICPFVDKIVNAKTKCVSDSEYESLISTAKSVSERIQQAKESNIIQDKLDKLEHVISSIFTEYSKYSKEVHVGLNILAKTDFSSRSVIEQFILSAKPVDLDLEIIKDLANLDIMIKSNSDELERLKTMYLKISSNLEFYKHLEEQKNEAQDKYFMYRDSFDKYDSAYKMYQKELNELTNTKNNIMRCIEIQKNNEKYNKEKQDVSNALNELYGKSNMIKEMEKEIDIRKTELNYISDKLPKLVDDLNRLKYNVVLYNDYLREYKEFTSKYNTIETIKKYTSPTTGIQTVFMNMYINDILSISNQLLGMLFKGEYVIHPFIINDSEFRIPCSGSGLLNDDISSMSSAQIAMISMIISFALLKKSSTIYNIIKIDEIDAPLDTINRLRFGELLIKIMSILNSQQCIMISHNSELGTNNSDIILLKNSDPSLKLEGNIIYNYNN